jgi:hypothetical protein
MLLAISECQHLKPFTNLDGTMLKSHIFNALENFGIFFFFSLRIISVKVKIKKLGLDQENTMFLINAKNASYLL